MKMRTIYILCFTLLVYTGAICQTSMGIVFGFSYKKIVPSGQALDNSLYLGMTLKKYLTPDLSLTSGAYYRLYDVTIGNLSHDNDLITHYKDAHPDKFFYTTSGQYFRFNYLVIPVGLEFKITTFLRVAYSLENNLLLGSNADTEEYFQYGKKAVAAHMFTSNFALLLHTGNSLGIALNATLHPKLLRSDVNYTYDFMNEWSQSFRDSYLITISVWGDLAFKKRKKI
jgi:hypothetical protein